ncbi:MAG TPA: hypothetical protein ENJ33_01660 [Thiothrix sp.]|nr:hypothetical protein [Thiothrix sp.]
MCLTCLWLLSSFVYALPLTENIDIDNDGLANDIEEALGSEPYLKDTDGDGIVDKDEVHDVMNPRDSDQDGRLDVVDLDDDNDGIPSVIEGVADIDNDKIPNYLDDDSDGDGLLDADEVRLSYRDEDNDYIDDLFDVDMTNRADKNGDGIIDGFVLFDSDNDGTADIWDNDGKTTIISKRPLTVKKEVFQDSVVLDVPKSMEKAHEDNKSAAETYGGSGFFYCANSGKIVSGISRFLITPSHHVALIKNASEGAYQWRTEKKGIYVLQFSLPVGMRVVQGLGKGRLILKETDESPTVLGKGESTSKKGYLEKTADNMQHWYTSFEVKKGAPLFINNNIPLQGELCDK